MSELTLDEILERSSIDTLAAVFGRVARMLIEKAGEVGELSDLPVRDQQTGELIGWLRGFRREIADMESVSGFREALNASVNSERIEAHDSLLLAAGSKRK